MKMNLNEYKNYIAGKRVAVIGLGISNMPLIHFLHKIGVQDIIAYDVNDSEESVAKVNKLKKEGIINEWHLGRYYLKSLPGRADIIFKTPIVRFDTPEILRAEEMGAEVTSEIEVLLKLCPCKVYGVTGSDGKTTTTTILHLLLSSASDGKVWVGGNIGTPLLQYLPEMKEADTVVLELSSFQLMNIKESPDVSIITNITPNHLDVHKSYDEYIQAKKMIFKNKPGATVILNNNNTVTRETACEVHGTVKMFAYDGESTNGAWYKDGIIYYTSGGETVQIMDRGNILLPGKHNVENYLAAVTAAFDTVPVENIRNIAETFGGVDHRMQLVRELNGVKYYNSSIDSSPNRTINALSIFAPKEVVMIAGGKDKNIPYDDIGAPVADKVKALILTGPTASKIEKAVIDEYERRKEACDIKIIHCETYEEAVYNAYMCAKSGDSVLLSPASTSFDMFKNFEERGNCFCEYVKKLPYSFDSYK